MLILNQLLNNKKLQPFKRVRFLFPKIYVLFFYKSSSNLKLIALEFCV